MIRVVLASAMLVAVLAGTAHAERVWVLWVSDDRVVYSKGTAASAGDTVWHILAAFTSKADCERQIGEEMALVTNRPAHDADVHYKVAGNGVSLAYFPKNAKPTDTITRSQILHYSCLPDTVDPRGPKSK